MQYLKQSTAVTVKIGPFVDQTDGFTVEDGLTISQADVRLSKAGGDFAQKNESTAAAAHDEFGYYDCLLNTTDTNTVGTLLLAVSEAGALPVWHEYTVLPANVYDSLIAGSDTLDVQVTGIANNAITAAALAADAVDEIIDEVVDDTLTLRQALRLMLSALTGKVSVSGSTVTFRDVADSKARITATVTSAGARSAVTRDAT